MKTGLRGDKVLLRAPRPADAAALHAAAQDVAAMMHLSGRPWVPESLESFAARHTERLGWEPREGRAWFVVADPDDDDLVLGEALVWGIDTHNRHANIGVGLVASARGQGLGPDVADVLCFYCFQLRGLHRLQIEASSSNPPSVRGAEAAGFRREAVLRQNEWAHGAFSDTVVLGLLADEWRAGVMPLRGTSAIGPGTVLRPRPVARSDGKRRDGSPGVAGEPWRLAGARVALRELRRSDLAALWAQGTDVDTWLLAQDEPWLPVPYLRWEKRFDDDLGEEQDPGQARFTVTDVGTGDLVGSSILWGIDEVRRIGRIGLTIVENRRGEGLGTDLLRVMCDYAFDVRGLHRVEVETLATNVALRAAAQRAGFAEEGVRREHAWVSGGFADLVVASLLAPEWKALRV